MASRMSCHCPKPSGAPELIDVVDDIPDRSKNPSAWKYLLIVLIFAGWVAFLIYCGITGRLTW